MRPLAALLLLAVLAHLGACTDTVDPTLGTEQAFSLYGYLDPTADRQAIRVAPIFTTLGADTLRSLPAEVTSVERGTGRTTTWRDSMVDFRDGSVGHIFVADYTPTPGETVEVSIQETAGDQRRTTVEVEVPPLDRPVVEPAVATANGVTYPIRVQAPRVLTAQLVFRVTGLVTADTASLAFDEVPPFVESEAGQWSLNLAFLPVARAFLQSEEVGGASLRLIDVTVRAFVTSSGWSVPAGGFDEDRIVEPGTFSNVAGGFGFVGAGFWAEETWTPSLATQQQSGFQVDADPATALIINEVNGSGWVEFYNPTLEAIPLSRYTVRTPGGAFEIPSGTAVPARGFNAITVSTALAGGRIELLSLSGTPLLFFETPLLLTEGGGSSYGRYPDGRSQLTGPVGSPDLFAGILRPTKGAPNRLFDFLGMVNEVYTEGRDGWVELFLAPTTEATVLVTHDWTLPLSDWVRARPESTFWVADETPNRLQLSQNGGEITVVLLLPMMEPRAYDVRAYGPQSPGRSSGLLPDGDHNAWTTGLLPSRDAPNLLARFGL